MNAPRSHMWGRTLPHLEGDLGGMAYAFEAGLRSIGQIVAYKPAARGIAWRAPGLASINNSTQFQF
jgi:hypothetical protein